MRIPPRAPTSLAASFVAVLGPLVAVLASLVAALAFTGCEQHPTMTVGVHGGPAPMGSAYEETEPQIAANVQGSTVRVVMRSWRRTCGPDPDFRFEAKGADLVISAIPPDGPMAAMQCEYTASYTITDVAPGEYRVIVKGAGGGELAQAKVIVPGG